MVFSRQMMQLDLVSIAAVVECVALSRERRGNDQEIINNDSDSIGWVDEWKVSLFNT